MKKTLSVILSILLVFSLAGATFAYKLSTAATIRIKEEIIPEGTDYIDLLILKEDAQKQKLYVDSNPEPSKLYSVSTSGVFDVDESGEINKLNDGYCSFYLHINGSSVSMPEKTEDGYLQIKYDIKNEDAGKFLKKCKTCKMVFTDRNGKILLMTDDFKVRANEFKDFTSIIVDGKSVTVKYQVLFHKIAILIIFIALIVFVAVKIKTKYMQPPKKSRK